MAELPRVPIATYRLQFNRAFTFRDAAALVPYLSALGISHCYTSPYLRARPGSSHGYDIIDHNALNPEIGTPEDYEHFVAELHRHGMGQIVDIVPNHMGVMGSDNSWWLDVLENGEASEYADFFDIDWSPIKDELQGKVLIPILDDQYGNVLENGDLRLVFNPEKGEFSIFFHQHRFPIDPSEYPRILGLRVDHLQGQGGTPNENFVELQSIATAFSHLARGRGLTAERQSERKQEKEVQKRRLAALCSRSPLVLDFLFANVEAMNGTPGDSRSFDALHELIKAQSYRLAQWRVAADDINYRRFFDINELAALRMENEAVFTSTHRFILELIAQGKIDGLRIDHPDGLYDPRQYFERLRTDIGAIPVSDSHSRRIYIVVEKILTADEKLRADWPVEGTTGYEFANVINGLFLDPTAATKMERIYRAFTAQRIEVADLVYSCKKLVLKVSLASELSVLANLVSQIALANRHTCDFTLNSLRSALAEIIACFPVYRTYISAGQVSDNDRHTIELAVAEARKRSRASDLSVFDFMQRVLLIGFQGDEPHWYKQAVTRFAMKFQQVTAAVMAKGLEDTAFYRYNRMVSLNEVGGNPSKFGTLPDEVHRANQLRLEQWPHSMLSSSTHDSKRSEDVRARIDVLSEIPALWRLKLRNWRDWNRSKKRLVDDKLAPTRNDEYLLYQTLVGIWPIQPMDEGERKSFTDRVEQYMLKAVREAKEQTSWANTNQEYEAALLNFTRSVLQARKRSRFLVDFPEFQQRVARAGILNSLSQCLLKLTSPGVPDIYQGNELWQFNLVDPDNRRAVDYDLRHRMLKDLQLNYSPSPDLPDRSADLLSNPRSDMAKLFVTWRTLTIRKQDPLLFERGRYLPLRVTGEKSNHVFAFAREYQDRWVIVAVPRLCASLLGETGTTLCDPSIWNDTAVEVPPTASPCFHHILTGECVPTDGPNQSSVMPVSLLFGKFPLCCLISEASDC